MNADLRARIDEVRRQRAHAQWATEGAVNDLLEVIDFLEAEGVRLVTMLDRLLNVLASVETELDAVTAERDRLAALLDEAAFAGLPGCEVTS